MAEAERLDPNESTWLNRYIEFLDEQDGILDSGDFHSLDTFLSRRTEMLRGDWEPIISSLREQGQDELATRLRRLTRIDFDEIATVLRATEDSEQWAILVGAGGSKPDPSGIPTVTEMLPVLWEKAAEINAPSLLRLKARCDELGITNIEDLLTAITLAQAAASNAKVTSLVEDLLFPESAEEKATTRRIGGIRSAASARAPRRVGSELVTSLSDSSQTLFSVLVGMMKDKPANAIHHAIARRVTRHADTVITTNYDVCLERALGEQGFDYRLEAIVGETGQGPKRARLLKLHGSLSWYACKNCDRYKTASVSEITTASEAGLYPVVTMCRNCDASAQQLIVPPIGAKYAEHPVLLDIRQRAEESFQRAGVIVVIGYSFSEADQYILRMLSRVLDAREHKLVIVFDRTGQAAQRLRTFLSTHSRFDVANRLISVVGPAEDTFTKFINVVEGPADKDASSAIKLEPVPATP
jgi:NAD-dependent SIR2 family protein deacetylase